MLTSPLCSVTPRTPRRLTRVMIAFTVNLYILSLLRYRLFIYLPDDVGSKGTGRGVEHRSIHVLLLRKSFLLSSCTVKVPPLRFILSLPIDICLVI